MPKLLLIWISVKKKKNTFYIIIFSFSLSTLHRHAGVLRNCDSQLNISLLSLGFWTCIGIEWSNLRVVFIWWGCDNNIDTINSELYNGVCHLKSYLLYPNVMSYLYPFSLIKLKKKNIILKWHECGFFKKKRRFWKWCNEMLLHWNKLQV